MNPNLLGISEKLVTPGLEQEIHNMSLKSIELEVRKMLKKMMGPCKRSVGIV